MVKILLVEDDTSLNKLISNSLEDFGYEVVSVENGEDAIKKFETEKVDIIVSDIMMPKMDGFELAKTIRLTNKNIPILFITAKDDLGSKQRGFNLGADDYLVKPFEPEELTLRVKALLRRAKIAETKILKIGNFVMNEEEHTATINGEELTLTVREFNILFKLLSFPKKPFTRASLMEEFWDYDSSATSRTVDVYMAKLREKTASVKEFDIVTVHGLGYKAVIHEI